MSAVVSLPLEVTHFLMQPPPRTLLVRGPAGSGKTTLVLTLLEAFPGRKVYVTSRVGTPKLSRDFPWLGTDEGRRISVVDALGRADNPSETARGLPFAKDAPRTPDAKAEGDERCMFPPLQEAWDLVPPGQPAMVAVDSWDALVERFLGASTPSGVGPLDRAEMEQRVLDHFSRGPFHTVFVLEREDPTRLDYLVDGVISLGRVSAEDRAERWLYLQKLRGVRLDSASYPFTLENARFQCITPMPAVVNPRLRPVEPDPTPVPGSLWPGSTEFAADFGRLSLGHLTLFETEGEVPEDAVGLVLAPIISQVIQSGGRVFHVLGPRTFPSAIWEQYRSLVSPEAFQRQVRVLTPVATEADVGPELKGVILPLPRRSDATVHPRTPEAFRFLHEGARTGAPSLTIAWAAGLSSLGALTGAPYRPETLPAIMLDYATLANVHAIFVGVTGDPLVESVRSAAVTRILFRSRAGRVFLYGKCPVTPPFVLIEGNDTTAYHLLRVV